MFSEHEWDLAAQAAARLSPRSHAAKDLIAKKHSLDT
jgi:hypothetical protein